MKCGTEFIHPYKVNTLYLHQFICSSGLQIIKKSVIRVPVLRTLLVESCISVTLANQMGKHFRDHPNKYGNDNCGVIICKKKCTLFNVITLETLATVVQG